MSTATEVRRALERAIIILTDRRGNTVNEQEINTIDLELPRLEQKHARIHQLIVSNNLPTLAAPTQEQIAAISRAAQQLDDIAANNTTANAVLALVRTAADVVRT